MARIALSMLLSCQRSIDSLNKTMSYVIQELLSDKDFRFYINSGSIKSSDYYLYSHTAQEFDEKLELSLVSEMEFADVSLLRKELKYFPALGDDNVYAIVVTPNLLDAETERHLVCFLAIYCNVLNLITDSRVDGLTGLENRKAFDLALIHELGGSHNNQNRRQKDESEVSQSYLAMIDIDHFKKVNDHHGHLIGDEVLLTLAQTMKASFRDHDGLFRYGGEEFAMILREIDQAGAEAVLQRFVEHIRNSRFPTVEHITVSVGYCYLAPGEVPSEVISCADKALYFAKENGRDQVANYYHLVENGLIKESAVETDIELF